MGLAVVAPLGDPLSSTRPAAASVTPGSDQTPLIMCSAERHTGLASSRCVPSKTTRS